jgi:hypothetical protein
VGSLCEIQHLGYQPKDFPIICGLIGWVFISVDMLSADFLQKREMIYLFSVVIYLF